MAVGEKRNTWVISQVSWTDWTAQDVYYWLEHSFQYASNINCDDEMHGIKLSQYAEYAPWVNAHCQLVSVWWNWVIALRTDTNTNPKIFNATNFSTWGNTIDASSSYNEKLSVCPWVVFQDYFWYWFSNQQGSWLYRINNTWAWTHDLFYPADHPDYTDESISTPAVWTWTQVMQWTITAILNYNNSRLIVACSSWTTDNSSIWVYYPELDQWKYQSENFYWRTGWKKVLEYESWVTIVALTCTFEYLKVRAVDEWWNTKVYYYQGNNNLRSTFVYNVIDLTGVRVTRVYSINGIDYYTASIDWTDWFVTLYKMVWNTPVELFHVRWWLDTLDINYKAPYFVWPCWLDAAYNMWKFYIADAYGLFQFTYNPQWYDKGYMKWKMRDQSWDYDISKINKNSAQPYWVCYNQWFIYVSDSWGCWKIRAYTTGKEWYQDKWVLISREYEGSEWGTITKMLDEIRLNYELNPDVNWDDEDEPYWTIDVYVSPNNLRRWTDPEEDEWWYKVMSITKTNKWTRTEKSNLFNNLDDWESAFKFDWQTITYAIVIKQDTNEHATPVVRQIDIKYHTKDKTNNVYNIN